MGKTTLENADVKHLTDEEAYLSLVNITSDDDVIVKDTVIGGDTRLESQKDTNIFSLTVDGNLTNTSDNTTVSGKLDVSGNANIDANKDVKIAEVTANNLTIKAENADITKSSTAGDTDVTTTGDTKIVEATVGGNFSNTSGNTVVSSKLDVTGDADIDAEKDVEIAEVTADNLTIEAENADITKSNTTGDTKITTRGDTKIAEATADNLTIEAENADITKSSTAGDTDVTTTGDTKIVEATVGGNFNNASNNTTVSGKLDVSGNANIDANKHIVIADANIGRDLNADAENIEISEMKLKGNINATVDNLSVNTSHDLHIGTISGNTADYTDTTNITSLKNVTNGLGSNDTNMSVKNANLTAGNSIGENKALNMKLAEGNHINITAGNVANLNNTGAAANYGDVIADNTKIKASNDVSIAHLSTDKLALKTQSENVNIAGEIKTKGTIDTASKNIVADNTSLAPYPDATTQLYLTKKPMHLIVDKSNNVRTESLNVTRHGMNTLVNKEAYATSMEGEITLASETALRNSYHGKAVKDEANDLLYNDATVSDYISSVVGSKDNLITDDKGLIINNINVMDIIRQRAPRKSLNKNLSQDDEKKKQKDKENLKKAENTLLKNINVAAILGK